MEKSLVQGMFGIEESERRQRRSRLKSTVNYLTETDQRRATNNALDWGMVEMDGDRKVEKVRGLRNASIRWAGRKMTRGEWSRRGTQRAENERDRIRPNCRVERGG